MPKQTPASQDFVAIKDIKNGVVILKNGQMCSVLLASSINFALKEIDEQQAILVQFQNFLNTLDFSIQVYVQSRRLNIEPYIAQLAAREKEQFNDLMLVQLREYINFIRTFTTEVDVMSKSFFVVVPYTPSPIDIKKGITNLFSPDKKNMVPADLQFEEQVMQLNQRMSVVEQGLNRIGVRTVALGTDELVELFYHIYNPTDPTGSAPVFNT